jgi:hypothetical protein
MSLLVILVIVLILLGVFGGTYSSSRYPAWGYWGWSPLGLLIVVLLLLYLTGHI